MRAALAERLTRERLKRGRAASGRVELTAIVKAFAALPVLDPRRPDEIIGYDDQGLPR